MVQNTQFVCPRPVRETHIEGVWNNSQLFNEIMPTICERLVTRDCAFS